jgi:hypothetical protein
VRLRGAFHSQFGRFAENKKEPPSGRTSRGGSLEDSLILHPSIASFKHPVDARPDDTERALPPVLIHQSRLGSVATVCQFGANLGRGRA